MRWINFPNIRGDLYGGFSAGLLNFFQSVPYGLIAFAPLGPSFEDRGIMACIIGMTVAGFFAALFGGSPSQITGPGATVCLAFSYIIIHFMDAHLFASGASSYIPSILTLAFLTLFISGFFQLLLGIFKVDFLIKFISYPVSAAIATGAGILICKNAFLKLLGFPDLLHLFTFWQHWEEIMYGNLIVGFATAVLLQYRTFFIKGGLGFPLAMAMGTGVYYLLTLFGIDSNSLGGTFQSFTFELHFGELFKSSIGVFNDAKSIYGLQSAIPLALNLAILCSLQSLLSVLVLKNATEKKANSRQELIGQGIGNMASGVFGGLPACGTFGRSFLNFQKGGRTKLSGMVAGISTLLFAILFSSLIQYLPKAVAMGVVLMLGFNAINAWSIKLFYKIITRKMVISKDVIVNAGIVLVVVSLIFIGHFMLAIGIGVLISILVFLEKIGDVLIKRVYESKSIPSKALYDESLMEFLTQHHQDIKVIELGGMIYFGSAEKLEGEIEKLIEKGALYIILDMKKVDDIDLTGARVLEKTYASLKRKERCLGFCSIRKGSPVCNFLESIQFFEKIDPSHLFPDTDHALEYFEDILLATHKQVREDRELELGEFPIFKEMTVEEMEIIKKSLNREMFPKGRTIFSEGDAGNAMFFIAKGTADVLLDIDGKDVSATKRIQTLSPGTFFGEMALLQKGRRTATVVASSDLTCYRLSVEKFQELIDGYTHLSATFLASIGKILSTRLAFLNNLYSEQE